MNLQKVKEIIDFYKKHFHEISDKEIYKWSAVKQFQENWDIESPNFLEMLEKSLSLTKNLLASGYYYAKRMLIENAAREPETVRQLFVELFDEEVDIQKRIIDFQSKFKELNSKYFPEAKPFQDLRAVLVYLNLHFPDRYFFFKFGIFKAFVEKVDYPYKPVQGRIENALVYSKLCELLKDEIIKDKELLELHTQRLTENEYFDSSYNILTQDVIYATEIHFGTFENSIEETSALERLVEVNKTLISSKPRKTILKGSSTNYIENEKVKKRRGYLGELLVLKYEQEKLKKMGSRKEPVHIAVTEGDGEGYDILSYDESDEEIFIEVKTTAGSYNSSFFITENELVKSINEKERFYLYRLYDFDEKQNSAKFFRRQGSLEKLCINPILYRVIVEEGQDEIFL